jgi:hypothetical protein
MIALLRFLSILRLRQTLMTPLFPNPKNAHAIMVTPHMLSLSQVSPSTCQRAPSEFAFLL